MLRWISSSRSKFFNHFILSSNSPAEMTPHSYFQHLVFISAKHIGDIFDAITVLTIKWLRSGEKREERQFKWVDYRTPYCGKNGFIQKNLTRQHSNACMALVRPFSVLHSLFKSRGLKSTHLRQSKDASPFCHLATKRQAIFRFRKVYAYIVNMEALLVPYTCFYLEYICLDVA